MKYEIPYKVKYWTGCTEEQYKMFLRDGIKDNYCPWVFFKTLEIAQLFNRTGIDWGTNKDVTYVFFPIELELTGEEEFYSEKSDIVGDVSFKLWLYPRPIEATQIPTYFRDIVVVDYHKE